MIMLLQLTITNFKTFKEKAVFSLLAANYDRETREVENVTAFSEFDLRVLKSAVVYGANASGKSKLFEAISFMQENILMSLAFSLKLPPTYSISFRLDTQTENLPSEFEVVFLCNGKIFRYGFEIEKGSIVSEWFFVRSHKKEMEIFSRKRNDFKVHRSLFKRGKNIIREGLVRENTLCLTVAASYNDDLALEVLGWFKGMQIFSAASEDSFANLTLSMLLEEATKQKVLKFLNASDLGITDISLVPSAFVGEIDSANSDWNRRKTSNNLDLFYEVKTLHKKFNGEKLLYDRESFLLEGDESSGTRKFFSLAGPIINALENGSILIVDELDSKLHPKLVLKIAELFNSATTNPRNAQLIFNTQNTHLLGSDQLRRDQVWFIEKDRFGKSNLFSLVEIKVRRTDRFENDYLDGKYGGMPFLGEFEDLKFSDSSKTFN